MTFLRISAVTSRVLVTASVGLLMTGLIGTGAASEPITADAGEAGWQALDVRVGPIASQEEFLQKMAQLDWWHRPAGDVQERHIEIGSYEVLDVPKPNSIPVFILGRYAADAAGQVYLLSYLG